MITFLIPPMDFKVYFLIGLITVILIEFSFSQGKNDKVLNWYERGIIFVFWQIPLLIFTLGFLYGIYSLIKEKIKK
jgi:ABC-type amino acid transport system permease subunit